MFGLSLSNLFASAVLALFLGAFPAAGQANKVEKATPPKDRWHVAIVIHDGVELLDFAGPGEVFASAGQQRAFRVSTVAETTSPITSQNFLKIIPNHSIADCPKPDIVVIPGGYTTKLLRSPAMMAWIKSVAADADVSFSVCTGAFVLAELGLLDGREATTHFASLKGLERDFPKIKVRSDRRIVDNGRIVTAAGVSAGIDGALHVVAKLCGLETAKRTARYMEYRWEPDAALTSLPAAKLPEAQARELWFVGAWEKAAAAYQKLVVSDGSDAVALYRLGSSQMRLGKFAEALPNLEQAVRSGLPGNEVLVELGYAHRRLGQAEKALACLEKALSQGLDEWSIHYDLACARSLLGKNEPALTSLEKAFAAGMGDVNGALLQPEFLGLRKEPRFRDIFRRYAKVRLLRLVTTDEPGQPLLVSGSVRGADGEPLANAMVEIHQADDTGHYTKEKAMDEPHARIFGYVRTGSDGRFEFQTVRPGHNPPRVGVEGDAANIPRHIHLNITASGHAPRRVQMVFADDPRLTPHWQAWAAKAGHPVVATTQGKDNLLRCSCNLKLDRK